MIKQEASFGAIAKSVVLTAGANVAGSRVSGTAFSWKAIAADAVSNAVSAGIGHRLDVKAPNMFGDAGDFRNNLANGVIGGIVSVHTRRQFGFNDRIDYGNFATDAFGNALGNAAGLKLQNYLTNRTRQSNVPMLSTDELVNWRPDGGGSNFDSTKIPGYFGLGNGSIGVDLLAVSEGNQQIGMTTYKVGPGDTLSELGKRFYNDMVLGTGVLAVDNNIHNPNKLVVGQTLSIRPMLEDGSIWGLSSDQLASIGTSISEWFDQNARTKEMRARQGDSAIDAAGHGASVPGWGHMALEEYYARSDIDEAMRSQQAYLANRDRKATPHFTEGGRENSDGLMVDDLQFATSLFFTAFEVQAGKAMESLRKFEIPEAAKVAKDWRSLASAFRYVGGGMDTAFGINEMRESKSIADTGHGAVSATLGGLTVFSLLDWPVTAIYGGGDLALQHFYGNYTIQFGPNAGQQAGGGWRGLYYSAADHHEIQIRQIMIQHELDRPSAESFYFSNHVK